MRNHHGRDLIHQQCKGGRTHRCGVGAACEKCKIKVYRAGEYFCSRCNKWSAGTQSEPIDYAVAMCDVSTVSCTECKAPIVVLVDRYN